MGEPNLDDDDGSAVEPKGPGVGRLIVAFVLSVAAGAALTAGLTFATRGDASGASYSYSEGAVHRELPGRGVELSSGQVVIDARREVEVITPDLEARVGAGRVTVAAEPRRSVVEVAAGDAEVHRARASLALRAGEKVTSDDARLDTPRLLAPRVDDGPCAGAEALECLTKAAAGNDAAAQEALLHLGLLALDEKDFAKALSFADRSLAKFPEGARLFDVHLVRFEAVSRLHRDDWARREAAWLLERDQAAPAAPWVALAWGDLELRARSWSAARRAYGTVLQLAATPDALVEAHYGLGLTELRADTPEAVAAAFEKALALDPKGPHAAELRRRLGR